MENADILKVLFVLVTAPWWVPLAQLVVRQCWRVSADETPRTETRVAEPCWRSERLEDRQLFNPYWGTGRRPPQPRAVRARAFERGR